MRGATIASATIAVSCAVLVAAGCSRPSGAQTGGAPVPYKVGTFERGGQAMVGLVLRDTQVVDIAAANTAFEAANASAPKLAAPRDMKQLDCPLRRRVEAAAGVDRT